MNDPKRLEEFRQFIRNLAEAQRRHRPHGGAAGLNRRRENIDYGAERLSETAEARRQGWEQ